ncbi:hypothetical protein Q3G72_020609 [Acer saccharum]|nr:hypothetical protein Q3G72_020609 [Acer saccharum]
MGLERNCRDAMAVGEKDELSLGKRVGLEAAFLRKKRLGRQKRRDDLGLGVGSFDELGLVSGFGCLEVFFKKLGRQVGETIRLGETIGVKEDTVQKARHDKGRILVLVPINNQVD